MPCFVCAKCECIENTATGFYWGRSRVLFKEGSLPKELAGKPLCSECAPAEFSDGTKTEWGVWHGKFEKEHWSKQFTLRPEGTF